VKFVCPSCGRTNVVPDIWHGNCFVCRKCETQITAPVLPDARVRPWFTSRGWLAVVGGGVLALASGALLIALFLTTTPPTDLPFFTHAGLHAPQLALPGGTLLIEWDPGLVSAGGYYRIVRQDVQLVLKDGRVLTPEVRAHPKPWPQDLVESTDSPEALTVPVSLEITLPTHDELEGLAATLCAGVHLEYPIQAAPGAPVELVRADPTQEWDITIATAGQANALASTTWARNAYFLGAIGCGILAIALAIAALAAAEKHITVICPACGRATETSYYHEHGAIHVTACPHRRG